jgi:hypothetical protein
MPYMVVNPIKLLPSHPYKYLGIRDYNGILKTLFQPILTAGGVFPY